MRLGKRPAGIGPGTGGKLIRLALGLSIMLAATARADSTTVGPARIICNAAFCELGSAARPRERVRVNASNLPGEDVHRLRKCTGVAKPCIVTIEGTQQGGPMRVMASSIQWQE